MGRSAATLALFFDSRRLKSDGAYPVKIRLTYQRVTRLYKTAIDLKPEEWDLLNDPSRQRFRGKLQETKVKLDYWLAKATAIVEQLPEFSFETFDVKFSGKEEKERKKLDDVYAAFEEYEKELHAEGRASTALSYGTAANSFRRFRKTLRFSDLSPSLLKEYERFMLSQAKDPQRTRTTIGIYTRSLRAIANRAIKAGLLPIEKYPFGRGKFEIPKGRNTKKALLRSDVKLIVQHVLPPGSSIERARDLWVFSYLCNGINFKDMCRLRWRNIDGDSLRFVRAKTEHTTRSNQRMIAVHLVPLAHEILKKWGSADQRPDHYVFPFYHEGITPLREREVGQNLIKDTNKYMRRIALEVGIDKTVTTYVARHSFATVLKRSGVSTEIISEGLGHADLKTTDNYLDSFEDETRREVSAVLTDF